MVSAAKDALLNKRKQQNFNKLKRLKTVEFDSERPAVSKRTAAASYKSSNDIPTTLNHARVIYARVFRVITYNQKRIPQLKRLYQSVAIMIKMFLQHYLLGEKLTKKLIHVQ